MHLIDIQWQQKGSRSEGVYIIMKAGKHNIKVIPENTTKSHTYEMNLKRYMHCTLLFVIYSVLIKESPVLKSKNTLIHLLGSVSQ